MVDFKAKLAEKRLKEKLDKALSGTAPSMFPDFGDDIPQLNATDMKPADRLAIIRVVDLMRNGYTAKVMLGDVQVHVYKTKKSLMFKVSQKGE